MTDCKNLDVNVCKLTTPGDEACDACQYRRAVDRAYRADACLDSVRRALSIAGHPADTAGQAPYCIEDLAHERDQWKAESSSAMRALAAWQTWAERLIRKAGKAEPGMAWGDKPARLILGGLLSPSKKRRARP